MAGGAPLGLMVTLVGRVGSAIARFSSSMATAIGTSEEPARVGPLPAVSQASM